MSKYLDYAGLAHLVEKIDQKYAPIAAVIFKGSVANPEALPALNTQKAGWMYNIEVGGATDSRFVEGPGHIIADGENVAVVELITGYTAASVAVTDDPKALGLYEVDQITYVEATDIQVGDDVTGLYESDGSGGYIVTSDATAQSGKTYYRQVVTYKLTQDRIPVTSKTYYEATTVNKYDLMGGLFDLEGRYLEFGTEFPKSPVDGRTFLYMGPDTKVYTAVASPSGRPADNGYFEGTFTAVVDQTAIVNPKEEGLYVADTVITGAYVHSSDIARDPLKTYYEGAFVASTDTTVDSGKIYYTEADQYKHAVIYQYDADSAVEDWVAQSASNDMIAITNSEIDELFI